MPFSMRVEGLEPPRRETLDPKSSASANSATRANSNMNYNSILETPNAIVTNI